VCCGLGRHFARQADVQGIQCLALFVNVVTGRTLYYVSPNLVRQILGPDEPERDALVQLLIDHATRPQRIYRHRWSPGDLLVWDNHALMHSPTDVGVYLQEQRLMHRSFTDSPTDEALQALLHKIIRRLMKLLTRRSVLVEEEEGGSRYLADADADADADSD